MRAAVGLGNPGPKYFHTRHNVGFQVLSLLGGGIQGGWCDAGSYLYRLCGSGNDSLLLARPMTYMNGSGEAVAGLLERFEVGLKDVLVVVDDVHLELGCLRFRRRGSDGGHNGLRSIIEVLGSAAFPRLRIGIGAPPAEVGLIDYVLGGFEAAEESAVERLIRAAAEGVMCWSTEGLDVAMNRFNAA